MWKEIAIAALAALAAGVPSIINGLKKWQHPAAATWLGYALDVYTVLARSDSPGTFKKFGTPSPPPPAVPVTDVSSRHPIELPPEIRSGEEEAK